MKRPDRPIQLTRQPVEFLFIGEDKGTAWVLRAAGHQTMGASYGWSLFEEKECPEVVAERARFAWASLRRNWHQTIRAKRSAVTRYLDSESFLGIITDELPQCVRLARAAVVGDEIRLWLTTGDGRDASWLIAAVPIRTANACGSPGALAGLIISEAQRAALALCEHPERFQVKP